MCLWTQIPDTNHSTNAFVKKIGQQRVMVDTYHPNGVGNSFETTVRVRRYNYANDSWNYVYEYPAKNGSQVLAMWLAEWFFA